MDDEIEFVNFENFLQSAAIVYGVHSQLQHEKVHIPEFDSIVSKMKQFLADRGMSFAEFAASPDFVRTTGTARICARYFYPELEAIFNVSLPKRKPLSSLDSYCKKLSFTQALETVRMHIL